jgi:ankyrin repeat protein
LAERGINVLATNHRGTNALHLAVTKNYLNIVEMLLASDYPIFLENSDGMNALHIASYHGLNEMMVLILDYIKSNQPD